jgi:hypothetical protein
VRVVAAGLVVIDDGESRPVLGLVAETNNYGSMSAVEAVVGRQADNEGMLPY